MAKALPTSTSSDLGGAAVCMSRVATGTVQRRAVLQG